jgi:hypothetical protein
MGLDPKIVEALHSVVASRKQPKQVAKRLEAWLAQISSGNISLERDEDSMLHLEATLEEILLPPAGLKEKA